MKIHKNSVTNMLMAAAVAFGVSAAPIALASPESSDQKQESADMSTMFENGLKQGKLESAILFNDELSFLDIETDVHEGIASLSGVVETEIEKDIAEQVALSVEGIKQVENNIVVDAEAAKSKAEKSSESLMDNISDAKITTVIKSKMAVNGHLSALDIDVDTDEREVKLSGKVESEELRELAQLIAENTSGVESVENELVVY